MCVCVQPYTVTHVSVMVSCSSFLQFQVMSSGSCTCLKIKEMSRVNVKFVGQDPDLVGFDQVSSPCPVLHAREVLFCYPFFIGKWVYFSHELCGRALNSFEVMNVLYQVRTNGW